MSIDELFENDLICFWKIVSETTFDENCYTRCRKCSGIPTDDYDEAIAEIENPNNPFICSYYTPICIYYQYISKNKLKKIFKNAEKKKKKI